MNSRTLQAIESCTRTLGGTPDAEVDFGRAGAVTIGPLRAAADRAALRLRFEHDAVHAVHRPENPAAASLYDALSQARLDVLGTRWLSGVAKNLLACPGVDDDGLRWLAFEAFSGQRAPREKAPLVASARASMPANLLDDLTALGALLGQPAGHGAGDAGDHARFAAAAASWSVRAVGHAPAPRSARGRFAVPEAPGGVDVRRGRYALPGRTRDGARQRDAADSGRTPDPAAGRDPVLALDGYRVFTTAFDRVVSAASLADRAELERLRAEIDGDLGRLRAMVSRLARRLLRVLLARQAREWRFDQDEGFLDPSRLPVFVASGGAARPYRQEFESPFPSTAVTLLIDHSGSMAGRPMRIAALTVEIFARVLERCGVTFEVLGFTTRDWDGGAPARAWADAGYPPGPGRLNALEHIIIKAADTPWRRARLALGLSLHDEMLKENIDGEALAWAHRRLLTRPEKRRVLIVVSDGTPMDEATFAANGFDYLDGHLAAVVQYIERRSPVRLAAIGIGHDVSQFYATATRVSSIDELGPALAAQLIQLIGDESRTSLA